MDPNDKLFEPDASDSEVSLTSTIKPEDPVYLVERILAEDATIAKPYLVKWAGFPGNDNHVTRHL